MKKKRIKTALIIIAILLLILAGAAVLMPKLTKNKPECKLDSDCVKVQTNCCPCSSGGGEKCVPALDIEKYKLTCDVNKFCIEVYNCNIEKCRCIEGKCAG